MEIITVIKKDKPTLVYMQPLQLPYESIKKNIKNLIIIIKNNKIIKLDKIDIYIKYYPKNYISIL